MSGAASEGLNAALLGDVCSMVSALGESADVLTQLRAAFPALRFSQCSEDDIPPRLPPSLSALGFDLYLMDTREHCIVLTTDAAVASGVVIAWRVEEDEV